MGQLPESAGASARVYWHEYFSSWSSCFHHEKQLDSFGVILCIVSCKDLFVFNPNELRLNEGESALNEKSIQKIRALPNKDTFTFILIGDTHRFYEQTEDFVREVNQRSDISFVLLAGDISDFGLAQEFRTVHGMLRGLKVPYIGVIGNHDMLANGRAVYQEMYGPENFSFTYSGSKFLCLNTNSNERGYDGTIPDLPWLRAELSAFRHVFVIAHMAPFHGGFHRLVEPAYASLMSSNPKIRLSLHGSQHSFEVARPYRDGFTYIAVGTIGKRNYAVITVYREGVALQEVYY